MVIPLVSTFGKYIKFYVNSQQEQLPTPSTQCRNAFEVLMSAAVQQALIKFPKKIVASTKKDEFYNAILEWIIKKVYVGNQLKLKMEQLRIPLELFKMCSGTMIKNLRRTRVC